MGFRDLDGYFRYLLEKGKFVESILNERRVPCPSHPRALTPLLCPIEFW